MREEKIETEVQTASVNAKKATGLMKKIIGVLMVLVMAASVAAPAAVAGPIGRNAVAAAAVPVNLYSTAVSGTVFGILGFDAILFTPSVFLAAVPFPGHTLLAAAPVFVEGGTEAILAASELVRLSSLAPIVHATIWNGIDLALLGTAAVATPVVLGAGALGAGALALGAPVALGAAALGTTAVVGTGLALGAGALGLAGLGAAGLGTTAVVGTGLTLGAAALGAGALATTAVVGTTALVGTGIVVHHLLNNSDENSENENTESGEAGTSTEDANTQNSESTENAGIPALAGEAVQA